MRHIKDKGPLRNFKLLKIADDELVRLSKSSGKDMTVVLEDLLLAQRRFAPGLESFIAAESERTGMDRLQILRAALYALSSSSKELESLAQRIVAEDIQELTRPAIGRDKPSKPAPRAVSPKRASRNR